LGSLACCLGPGAVADVTAGFGTWLDRQGYPDLASLRDEALQLFTMPPALAHERDRRLGRAYRVAAVDRSKCNGCGHCIDACWHDGIAIVDGAAEKAQACIGCGYCFQVCPTGALHVEAGEILASVWG
jgi:dihydropyrimidine dehydrogenase (NAD+) subunit PreA